MNGETVCLLNHFLGVSDPYRNVMMVFSQTLVGIYARAVRTVDAHTVEAGTVGKESHDRKRLSQACGSPKAPLNVCAEFAHRVRTDRFRIATDAPNAQTLSSRATGEVPYIGITGGVVGS